MKLVINSNAFVEINKLLSVKEIKTQITDYKLEDNYLEGNVEISGEYVADDMNTMSDFKKEVPFTIIFSERNIKIMEIKIVDLKYQEVINQGIEVSFNIVAEYMINEIEVNDEFIEIIDDEKYEDDDKQEANDKQDENAKQDENDNIMLIKEDITKGYEKILDELFFEDSRDNLEISELKKENNRVSFTKLKSTYSSYRVYYPKNEADLEKICKEENKSLDEVYRNNKDYLDKRRIILK